MKKYIIYTILAISTLASCQKNLIDEIPAISSAQTLIVSVQPNNEPQSRVALTDGASNVTLDWESDDSFTLYTTDGERVVDFKYASKSNDDRILFTSADENVKLSDNENYIAIYPAVEGVTTLDAHRAELESRLSEQTQIGNNSNSHIEKALRMEAEFIYNADSDTNIIFEHKTAIMRITFASQGAIPSKISYKDGDFREYTLLFNELSDLNSNSYTANFVIEPNDAGEKRNVTLLIFRDDSNVPITVFTTNTNVEYSKGVQYRSALISSDMSMCIYNKSDLIAFRDRVNSGERTLNAVLMRNIDLNNEEWIPIGVRQNLCYAGVFDGRGFAVLNLTISDSRNDNMGFFGYVSEGHILNLTIDNPHINGNMNTGAVCGYIVSGRIQSCKTINGTISGGTYVGGIVGCSVSDEFGTNNADVNIIIDCKNSSSIFGESHVGGVAGVSTNILSCKNTGVVSGSLNRIGGVVGYASSPITSCDNRGTVWGGYGSVGGVVGETSSNINDCYNFAKISGDRNSVGGIVGFAWGSLAIKSCINKSDISGKSSVGGIAGCCSSVSIKECCNLGSISAKESNAGGVVGYNTSHTKEITSITACSNESDVIAGNENVGGITGTTNTSICSCYNTGAIYGSEVVGGIAGNLASSYENEAPAINDCYNIGSIDGGNDVGGIVGIAYLYPTISDCYYQKYEDSPYTNNYGILSSTLIAKMKSSEIISTLNTAAGETYWGYDSNNKNNGYPILVNIDYK